MKGIVSMRGNIPTMFRKTSGAILCPSCGRLTNADALVCLVCGRRNPGMWGFGGTLGTLFRRWNFINAVTVLCVVLYVASIVLDPASARSEEHTSELQSPCNLVCRLLLEKKTTPYRPANFRRQRS